jgi:AcrR family transcriptional regulator
VSSRQAERAGATRAVLIERARALFAERGYAGVSTEEIVRAAAVTRGALYHHFEDKRDLFRAVFEQIEQENVEQIAAAALSREDPWSQQLAAVGAFLDLCREPDVQRIVLVDAPSVLGWQEWRELEARYGLALVRAGLELAMQEGIIERRPVEPLAQVVLGALIEAGLVIAAAQEPDAARREVGESIERLLEGLLVRRDDPDSPGGATRSGGRSAPRAARRGKG